MTQFVVGRPVTTETPTIAVDAGLALGSHRFRLQVVDSAGNVSKADEAVVQVLRQVVTPDVPLDGVLTPVRPDPVGPVSGPVVTPVVTPAVTPVIGPTPITRPN